MSADLIRCRECKHWNSIAFTPIKPGWGRCKLTESTGGDNFNPESLAVAVDAEDYFAALETAPEFGCVSGESKL